MKRIIPRLWILLTVLLNQSSVTAQAQDLVEESESVRWNLASPTLGGKQFWTDIQFFHDWHIQHNVVTGHYRLLDGAGTRHAWGTLDLCQAELSRKIDERHLAPMDGTAVILLHGLARTHTSMNGIATRLREQAGYDVFNMQYASTRADLAAHAKALSDVISHLDGIETIHLVGHSLGNLVIRHYLGDQTDAATGQLRETRIGRIVMLCPPNQGSKMAETFGRNLAFKTVVGPSGQQMARYWRTLQPKLAVPAVEFAIIAGGSPSETGFNPLVTGNDDLILTVEETKLPGARDFRVMPSSHTFIMDKPDVQEAIHNFLRHGYLVSEATRQPIPAEP